MPDKQDPDIEDPEIREHLRREGYGKAKAADLDPQQIEDEMEQQTDDD